MGMKQNAPTIRQGIEMEIRAEKGKSYNRKDEGLENGSGRDRQIRKIIRTLNNDAGRMNCREEVKREDIGATPIHFHR